MDWYQNKWPWPLFRGGIKVTSTTALHLTLNITETVRDIGLVPKDHKLWSTTGNGNMGYQMVTWPMTSCDLERSRAQYLETAGFREHVETPFQRTTYRNGLWAMVGYPSDSLASSITWSQLNVTFLCTHSHIVYKYKLHIFRLANGTVSAQRQALRPLLKAITLTTMYKSDSRHNFEPLSTRNIERNAIRRAPQLNAPRTLFGVRVCDKLSAVFSDLAAPPQDLSCGPSLSSPLFP